MAWYQIQDYIDCRFRKSDGDKSERRLFDEWAAGKEIIRFAYGPLDFYDVRSYLRTGWYRGRRRGHFEARPPFIDHAVAFKRADGRTWLTYQPYRDADEIRPAVEEWAAAAGVLAKAYDKDRSWYYPGHTCLVVVSLPEESQSLGNGEE